MRNDRFLVMPTENKIQKTKYKEGGGHGHGPPFRYSFISDSRWQASRWNAQYSMK